MTGMIDSHAHICGRELFPRWNEVVAGAKEAGIEKIMIVCTETEEAERAVAIAEKDAMFDVACGFYPNDLLKVTKDDWRRLEKLLVSPRIKAVGEIGMDYFPYEKTVPNEVQRDAFIRQIRMANELKKPVLIHMRLATEDTSRCLREHLKVPGIMHCYSGGYEAMEDFLSMGMYLSFSGNITFELEDESTQRVISEVPLDRLLVETDAPSLTPAPMQGKANEPKYIKYVLDHICLLRKMERQTLIRAVNENYRRLMG